jgi:hypothetical protein
MHKGFERAHGGTLFLDEITETVDIQLRLLRALETAAVTPRGGERSPSRWTCASSPPPAVGSRRRWRVASCARTTPERLPHTPSPAARAGRRHRASGGADPGRSERGGGVQQALHPGVPRSAPPAHLAGERARAAERDRARFHPGRGRPRRRFPAPRRHRGGSGHEPGDAGGNPHRGDGAAVHPRHPRPLRRQQQKGRPGS